MTRIASLTHAVALFAVLASGSGCRKIESGGRPATATGATLATTSQQSATSGTAALTYFGDAKRVLDRVCVPCHGPKPRAGAPDGFVLSAYEDFGDKAGVRGELTAMRGALDSGRMPVGGYKLTVAEKQILIDWIDAGGAAGAAAAATSTTAAGQAAAGAAAVTPAAAPGITVPDSAVSGGTAADSAAGATSAPLAADAVPSHELQFSLTSPATAGETADQSYVVQVATLNPPDGATWALYYTQMKGATSGGTLLVSGQAPATTTYIWNTGALTAGVYGLYAELSSAGRLLSSAPAAGTVNVVHAGTANHAPLVTLTSPNGGTVLLSGATVSITFTASDPDGDSLTFKLSACNDGGQVWTPIVTGLKEQSYDWTIPASLTQGTGYRIRVTADDGRGGVTNVSSSSTFGIATNPVTYGGQVKAMLGSHCSPCHSSGGADSSFFTWDVYSGTNAAAFPLRNNANGELQAGFMPPGGGVSQADRDLMQLWIWSGAPP